MSYINDGGPAYPFTPNPQPRNSDGTWIQNWDEGESGMTIRDHFAGLAMQMEIGGSHQENGAPLSISECGPIAMRSYMMADAMIQARSVASEVTP